MPTTYEKAADDVTALAAQIMRQYRGDLVEAGVAVAYLMARNPDAAAVTVAGYPCAAKVKVIGLKERADGRADAEVVIDAGEWWDATEGRHRALIDHELHHLELKRDRKTNRVKRDDLGRPLLGLRKHDHQFGWFDEIAHRHGADSYEVSQAQAFADRHGQTYFGWTVPPDRPTETALSAVKKLAGLVGKGGITSVTMQAGDGPRHVIAGDDPDQMTIDDVIADPDAWSRAADAEPAAALGLPDALLEKLAGAIDHDGRPLTVGDVAGWCRGGRDRRKIAGVGKGEQDAVDAALEAFYLSRMPNRPAEPDPSSEAWDRVDAERRASRAAMADVSDGTAAVEPSDPYAAADAELRRLFGGAEREQYGDELLDDALVRGEGELLVDRSDVLDALWHVIEPTGGRGTLGDLADSLATGEPLSALYPTLTPVGATVLANAVRDHFGRKGWLPVAESVGNAADADEPADAHPPVAALEASAGKTRPSVKESPAVRSGWESEIGHPIRLEGHAGLYAAVGRVRERDEYVYEMQPVVPVDDVPAWTTYGARLSVDPHAETDPGRVSLAEVKCRAPDGREYVFGSPAVPIRVPLGTWQDWHAGRQATADVAAAKRAGGKAVGA